MSFYDNLLCLHVVAADETQHVNARHHLVGRDVACNVCTTNDVSHHVNHLQGACAVDDDVAIADEGEGP